ncbi:MAG TPA: threonine--tRNA ligase [Nitrososphaerales archaeon]|nr:threonine--tRNA ligase [Nitrososphaerales archaeon]
MRILQLHCDEIEYQPVKKEIPSAEDASNDKVAISESILLLISVEKGDEDPSVIKQVAADVEKTSHQLGCNSFVVYPYAHLSSNLASPTVARSVLTSVEESLARLGKKAYHVPFGWNKALTMKVKGHPLAEQSKEYHPVAIAAEVASSQVTVETKRKGEEKEGIVSAALRAEDTLKSQWLIIDTEGNLTPVSEFNFSRHRNLERLKNYETAKVRAVQQIPPHVMLMKKLGISDYEPASDPGNIRYYPKGRMIKSLLERYVTQRIQEYGGVEVETPIMYDLEHPSLASYLNRFPARQYLVKSDEKEYFLRFAACFGQFLIAKDMQLTYKQLPLKLYELTRYSFRREKSGELVGLRRLRAFTMPDCHAIVKDMQQAKEEFPKRFKLSQSVLEEIGFSSDDYELAIRFTEDFYRENKEFIASIIKLHGRPALVEMWKERFFYFVLKWEFNFIDNLDKASALSTDQIDIENAQRYGIAYVDELGKKQTPLILHNSPSGAIERCIFGLLEKAAREQKENKTPMLPIWLCPTQVRFIPVSQKYLELSESIALKTQREGIRADVDDREESVGKRIREAEREWVPYVIVVGDKEAADQAKLTVRVRAKGANVEMSQEDVIGEVTSHAKGKPILPLPLPMLLSRRPYFESIT